MKHLEASFAGSIKRIQLDNQMLDATQPVVLAPATVAHAHSKTAQALTGQDSALVEFGISRSFANTVMRGGEQVRPSGPLQPPSSSAVGLHRSLAIPFVTLDSSLTDVMAERGTKQKTRGTRFSPSRLEQCLVK